MERIIMRRPKKALLLASVLALTLGGHANATKLCEGFLPPNNMKIPVGDHSHIGKSNAGGLTEAQYNAIMDRIQSLFGDVVKSKGGTLVINRLWTDDTVNSSAEQQGNQWIINMYGGIARHPDITVEGEALVACHEMGHHLGGAPKEEGTWATDEGGADYFATLKCLKEFFALDDNGTILSGMTLDPLAQKDCAAQYSDVKSQDICLRISKSAESVAYLFQDLSQESTRPQFSTPDTSQVDQTNDDHPATQCRMDTYFNGDLCTAPVTTAQSDTDWKVGACVQGTDAMGFRPRCWFQPNPPTGGGGGGGGTACPLGDQTICQEACQVLPTLPWCS
jgi:hypothetical protein